MGFAAISMHCEGEGTTLDGAMFGRTARDEPWLFASVDSALVGDADEFSGVSAIEARLRVIERYADYCADEQSQGHERSRELLLKPLNQLFHGMQQKNAFARMVRVAPKQRRPPLFADELRGAVEALRVMNQKGLDTETDRDRDSECAAAVRADVLPTPRVRRVQQPTSTAARRKVKRPAAAMVNQTEVTAVSKFKNLAKLGSS